MHDAYLCGRLPLVLGQAPRPHLVAADSRLLSVMKVHQQLQRTDCTHACEALLSTALLSLQLADVVVHPLTANSHRPSAHPRAHPRACLLDQDVDAAHSKGQQLAEPHLCPELAV